MVKKLSVILVIVLVTGISLVWLTGTSEAQGPGGRRGGQGSQGMGSQSFGPQSTGSQGMGAQMGGYRQGADNTGLHLMLPPASTEPLTDDAIAALNAGLQDEYRAAAIYQAVIDQFGAVRPFTMILNAEISHAASLEFLFERYSLDIPAPLPLGELPQFATLAEACAAGAEAEVANLELYDSWMETVAAYPDLVAVFTNLRDASEFQHLPAFERCAGYVQ